MCVCARALAAGDGDRGTNRADLALKTFFLCVWGWDGGRGGGDVRRMAGWQMVRKSLL